MCSDLNLPLLGKVPLDPKIARSCDEGKSFLREVPDSPAAKVYQSIVQSEFFSFLKRTHKHFTSLFIKDARQSRLSGKCGVFDDKMLVLLMSQYQVKYFERRSYRFTNGKQSFKEE